MNRLAERDLELEMLNAGEPPEVWLDCPECGGEGGWEQHCRTYELGCGFAHDDSEWRACHVCNGTGSMICEAESDHG